MESIFSLALNRIVEALESEGIAYMIVGGFAVSYHNRARTTNDIDLVVQIYPKHVEKILTHFPDWMGFKGAFEQNVANGQLFNITDFETGIRYDFMVYQDSDYTYEAFQRRVHVDFMGRSCWMSSKEDLVVSKLKWYAASKSEKQLEDLKFLLLDPLLDMDYIRHWTKRLNIKTHGILDA